MFTIDIKSNAAAFARQMQSDVKRQVAFAAAYALNLVAKDVQAAEQAEMGRVFDRPMAFTTRGVRIRPASKSKLVAEVYIQDRTAEYIEPYVRGGLPKLPGSSRAGLGPRNVSLNQFGGLGRARVKQLAGRPDVFVGAVQTKAGEVRGVWQRPTARGGKKRPGMRAGKVAANRSGQLKLLVRFEDPLPVTKKFDFFGVAQRTVERQMQVRMQQAWAKALATARPR